MILFKRYFGNFLVLTVLIFILSKQIPLWMHSSEQSGKIFSEMHTLNLSGEKVTITSDKIKKIYIFWTTWCGPCHIQLAQFEKAVTSGDLPQDQVVGVSLDTSLADLVFFQNKKNYSFLIVQASPEQSQKNP